MAFIGIIGVIGVVGAAIYDDHSRHTNYSDAYQKQLLREEQLRKERTAARSNYKKRAREEFKKLEEEYSCKLFESVEEEKMLKYDRVDGLEDFVEKKINKIIHDKIEADIAEDCKELDRINSLITKINSIQLTHKK